MPSNYFDMKYAVSEYADEEEQLKAFEKIDADIKAADRKHWEAVLNSYSGRYVLYQILDEFSKPFAMSFDSFSRRMTDFREGERNVGNKIVGKVNGISSERFVQMGREEEHRQKSYQTKREQAMIKIEQEEFNYEH